MERVTQLILRSPYPRVLADPHYERAAVTLTAVVVFLPYMVINRVTEAWPAHDLGGVVDRAVGFDARWELVYASIYLSLFMPCVYFRDPLLFRRTALAFCLVQVLCFGIFLAFPVGIARPEQTLAIDESFLAWGVALNYWLDRPRNLFPSLHLANAFVVSFAVWKVDRVVGNLALAWSVLIGYSTMAAKHHFFADVVAGTVLGYVAYRLVIAPVAVEGVPRSASCYSRWNALLMPGLYAAIVLALYVAWRYGWRPFPWPVSY